ncbi:MAG: SRPBCC family protein [Moheibacter sp.]
MKILKKILFLFVALIALVLITALFAPKEFKGTAQVHINKPKQEIYDYIKFLKNQDNYGTWNQMDPQMKKSYEGTDGTVGFTHTWESEKWMVGNGKQVITNLIEGEKMESDLFFEGYDDPAKSVISLSEEPAGHTIVNWTVIGQSSYPWNIMNLFFNMDSEFEKGLENLKNELKK